MRETDATSLLVYLPPPRPPLLQHLPHGASPLLLLLVVLPLLHPLPRGASGITLLPAPLHHPPRRHPAHPPGEFVPQDPTRQRAPGTGAGGSIGVELCRQLAGFGPASLVMLDRDESASTSRSWLSRARPARLPATRPRRHPRPRPRSSRSSSSTARGRVPRRRAEAPAAARVQPAEAWKTNVVGTHNVLEAARAVGVEHLRQHLDRQGGRPRQRARATPSASASA